MNAEKEDEFRSTSVEAGGSVLLRALEFEC